MKSVVAALAIFVVSVVVLYVLLMVSEFTSGRAVRATGVGVLRVHGITFMYVGALYLLAGLIMRFGIA